MLLNESEEVVEKWTELTADLLSEILPILMQRLPDWTLVEATKSEEK